MTTQPHAYRVEILHNPGGFNERWAPADSDDWNTAEEAENDRDAYVAEGFAPEQVRVAAITVLASPSERREQARAEVESGLRSAASYAEMKGRED